ncbi:T9SS C-terminal target domain-containing protein [Flavobacterium circumlabens]|uniref:Secreted protein (Por secretion system target) n=1 Tax=Flavobacterium circumlabens TaxID=2133765 RepID=A0A4Y7UB01_9FLAO|nr:T9SS type A sorting domain-containing protein [Flavobacterium circumlabens]TCN56605.1 putative secreted protein (Por secretion system target) [Flavobacterium circumlabens]TEB43616.1 T9SS C-terminal target domain-containing protein [Flavobacterium circumlabens]
MIQKLLFTLLLAPAVLTAQSYAPAAGQTGSTAIAKSSTVFKSWATGINVVRGPQDIANPTGPLASTGDPSGALGGTSTSVVCLGDGGSATLTFATPIVNGPGFDFAVFENGFSDTFLELAFVEVSSNGVNFFRFPSHSQTQTTSQIGGFGAVDCRYINNLAGKYRVNFGTPFDLSDVPNNALLDKNNITHVRVIDVIGTINPLYASHDSLGNIINDPYSTPYPTGGFDLNAVGVINQKTVLSAKNFDLTSVTLYPNPTTDIVYLDTDQQSSILIYDIAGTVRKKLPVAQYNAIQVSDLSPGIYLFEITIDEKKTTKRIVIR